MWTRDWMALQPRVAFLALALIAALPGLAPAQDRIILRNTRVVTGRSVVAFDPDGVRLSGNPPLVLGWDEIEAARLSKDQTRFDALLKQLGDPLYRIRLRLANGDYRDILAQAEAVFPTYANRRSPTAYMVFTALMWSRLAQGQREKALEPYLLALECLRLTPGQSIPLPGERQPKLSVQSGLSSDLLPIWFDPAAAKAALPGVLKALGTVRPPVPPGLDVYAATLALAAGEPDEADRLLAKVQADTQSIHDLLRVVAAQRELNGPDGGRAGPAVAALERALRSDDFSQEPLARYWVGLAKLRSGDERARKEGVVELLHLPALFGESHPEIAAAALDKSQQALEALGDPGASVLRSELLFRYPATVAAARLKSELDAGRGAEEPERPTSREGR